MRTRLVIALMAFAMFLLGQMVRININIAIVNMETNGTVAGWDNKAVILGSYYWFGWMAELPSGVLAQRHGSRRVLAISMLTSGVGSLVFPAAYKFHPLSAAFVRAFQGLAMGAMWPSMACISARWVPKNERSKFMTSYHGVAIGSCITFALGGVAIDTFGWPCLFYATGLLCLLWTALWWRNGFDSPSKHPRISREEKQYLDRAIQTTNPTSKHSSPWSKILTSKPFWAVFVASFGLIWSSSTLMIHLPTYFDEVHNLNIKTTGLILSLPTIFKFLFGMQFSTLIDYWIKNDKISITTARKLGVTMTHFVPALFLIFLGLYGSVSIEIAAALIISIITFGGASSSGTLANIIDINPDNAGTVMGIIRTLCVIPGILSPIVVNQLTYNNVNNWALIYLSTAAILLFTCACFLIFGSGEVQNWNEDIGLNEYETKEKLNRDKTNVDINEKCV